MRIAVLGAGAMGGALAALLDRAGHDVEATARAAGLEAIGRHGIRLSGGWGDHTARILSGETLSRTPDLALVTTKAMDAHAAVRANRQWLRGVTVIVVQNGLGGVEAIARLLPDSPIVGALSLIAASYRAPGQVTVTAPAGTWLGVIDGDIAAAQSAAQILRDAVPVTVTENFAGARWTKLIINQVNALPAITGLSVQAVVTHDGLRRAMAHSMHEAVRVARAHDINFEEINGVTPQMLEAVAAGTPAAAEELPRFIADYLGDVPNPGSTLQSIRRGRPTEIDHLNGAVVTAAHTVGLDAPINARLTALVHQVERDRRHLSPDETLQALRLDATNSG